MNSGPGWQNALVPWGWPGQLPAPDVENWFVGKRGVEKAEVASSGKGWSGGAETAAVEKGQAGENALDWREKKGSAGLVGVGTEPDLGAYAVGGSWGWAEQGNPSVVEEVAAGRPADWLQPLLPRPGGAGPSVPCSLVASVACDAASFVAAAAAAVGGSQLLGVAGTGCGWPSRGQFRALLPAAASSAAVSGCLGTVQAWCCGSCSSAEPGGSSLPWVAAFAAVVAAGAGRPSGHPPAWDSCSAWLDWSGPPAEQAWQGAAALAGPGACQAAQGGFAD